MLQDYIKPKTDRSASSKILSLRGLGIVSLILVGLLPLVLLGGLYFGFKKTLLQKSQPIKTETTLVAANAIEEGKSYDRLSAKIVSHQEIQDFIAKDPGKVQMIEFFSYGCYGCSLLHPVIEEWLATRKPPDLAFYRVPIVFKKGWDVLAKAYYVISELKRHDIDKDFFAAIQQKNLNLSDESLLKQFFVEHGISENKFTELYASFNTTHAYTKGENLNKAYQITISPVIVLNLPSGSYLLTTTKAGGNQELIKVLDFLLNKERESAALAAATHKNQNTALQKTP